MSDYYFIHQIAMIADYYYPPGGVKYDNQWQHLNKPFIHEIIPTMKPNSIIFADTLWLDRFEIFNDIQVPFILITAEADVTIPYNNYSKQIQCCYSVLNNPLLVKWFSINVDYSHPKLIPIPIGLPKHIPYIVNKINEPAYMGWVINFQINQVSKFIATKNKTIRDKKHLLLYTRMTVQNSDYCFHDKEGIRRKALKILEDKFDMSQSQSLVNWEDYIEELMDYKFCLSLPGKGMDCYRTWEALTLGVIPIVLKTKHMDSIYEDLPVLIVDNLEILTEDYLNKQYEIIMNKKYNYNKLTSSYWIDIILGYT